MTYLLIDNSNTRTKFVLSSPEALLPERYMVPTREVSGERLDEVLAGVLYDAAVVCSVVPRVAEELKNWIVKPSHFLSCDSRLGVGIDYPHPRHDRGRQAGECRRSCGLLRVSLRCGGLWHRRDF